MWRSILFPLILPGTAERESTVELYSGSRIGDPYGCAWMYGDTVMAYINPEYCREATVDEVDDFGGYCYNSGADDVRIFSS